MDMKDFYCILLDHIDSLWFFQFGQEDLAEFYDCIWDAATKEFTVLRCVTPSGFTFRVNRTIEVSEFNNEYLDRWFIEEDMSPYFDELNSILCENIEICLNEFARAQHPVMNGLLDQIFDESITQLR